MTYRLPKAALLIALPLAVSPALAEPETRETPQTTEEVKQVKEAVTQGDEAVAETEEAAAEAEEAIAEAQEAATEAQETVTEAEEPVAEAKICRRIALETASRRRTKVCLTREEWKTFNRDQRRN
ncbi:MAG: hypothetical protein AAGH57_07325 [Pseudomonadota bacterium]